MLFRFRGLSQRRRNRSYESAKQLLWAWPALQLLFSPSPRVFIYLILLGDLLFDLYRFTHQ
jgi:hypothetical protein